MVRLFILNQKCDMRNRIDILKDLVFYNGDLSVLKKELSQYSWDAEKPYLVITKPQLLKVLIKCIDQIITFQNLEDWADAIECRDDLDFESEEIQEIIFELSSPEINGEITKERLQEIVNDLSK
jgi:hypothetical protein